MPTIKGQRPTATDKAGKPITAAIDNPEGYKDWWDTLGTYFDQINGQMQMEIDPDSDRMQIAVQLSKEWEFGEGLIHNEEGKPIDDKGKLLTPEQIKDHQGKLEAVRFNALFAPFENAYNKYRVAYQILAQEKDKLRKEREGSGDFKGIGLTADEIASCKDQAEQDRLLAEKKEKDIANYIDEQTRGTKARRAADATLADMQMEYYALEEYREMRKEVKKGMDRTEMVKTAVWAASTIAVTIGLGLAADVAYIGGVLAGGSAMVTVWPVVLLVLTFSAMGWALRQLYRNLQRGESVGVPLAIIVGIVAGLGAAAYWGGLGTYLAVSTGPILATASSWLTTVAALGPIEAMLTNIPAILLKGFALGSGAGFLFIPALAIGAFILYQGWQAIKRNAMKPENQNEWWAQLARWTFTLPGLTWEGKPITLSSGQIASGVIIALMLGLSMISGVGGMVALSVLAGIVGITLIGLFVNGIRQWLITRSVNAHIMGERLPKLSEQVREHLKKKDFELDCGALLKDANEAVDVARASGDTKAITQAERNLAKAKARVERVEEQMSKLPSNSKENKEKGGSNDKLRQDAEDIIKKIEQSQPLNEQEDTKLRTAADAVFKRLQSDIDAIEKLEKETSQRPGVRSVAESQAQVVEKFTALQNAQVALGALMKPGKDAKAEDLQFEDAMQDIVDGRQPIRLPANASSEIRAAANRVSAAHKAWKGEVRLRDESVSTQKTEQDDVITKLQKEITRLSAPEAALVAECKALLDNIASNPSQAMTVTRIKLAHAKKLLNEITKPKAQLAYEKAEDAVDEKQDALYKAQDALYQRRLVVGPAPAPALGVVDPAALEEATAATAVTELQDACTARDTVKAVEGVVARKNESQKHGPGLSKKLRDHKESIVKLKNQLARHVEISPEDSEALRELSLPQRQKVAALRRKSPGIGIRQATAQMQLESSQADLKNDQAALDVQEEVTKLQGKQASVNEDIIAVNLKSTLNMAIDLLKETRGVLVKSAKGWQGNWAGKTTAKLDASIAAGEKATNAREISTALKDCKQLMKGFHELDFGALDMDQQWAQQQFSQAVQLPGSDLLTRLQLGEQQAGEALGQEQQFRHQQQQKAAATLSHVGSWASNGTDPSSTSSSQRAFGNSSS